MSRSRPVSLVLALVTLLVFLPVRKHGFINYDDPDYVTENRHVQAGLTVAGLKWAFTTWHASNWHPLTWLSHMLDCELFGVDAGTHHIVNVLFHAANAVLLFLLLRRMTGVHWSSAFVAGLFAWHPLHVESVAWVAERKDVLSTWFWLLTTMAYVRYATQDDRRGYWLALICFALGLMAKPMLVTLPFTLLLLDYWPLRRMAGTIGPEQTNAARSLTGRAQRSLAHLAGEKWPFFALSAISSVVTFLAQRSEAVMSVERFPLDQRIGNALISYLLYLVKMVWPLNLTVIYPLPEKVDWWAVAGSLTALAALSYWIWRTRRRRPYLLVGWLWYLGTLVPVIGLVQVGGQAMADRYTYVPLIGVFVMLAWGAQEVATRFRLRAPPLALAAGAALGACLVVTRQHLPYWRDSHALFAHALSVTKENAIAHINLGVALEAEGELDEALSHYREALRINPNRAQAHNNLGNLLDVTGKPEEAIAQYQEALRLKPGAALVHNNLGLTLAGLGRFDEAMAHYAEAARLKPDDPQPHYLMGTAALRQGRSQEAIEHFRAALRLDPNHAKALNQLARVLAADENPALRNGADAVQLAERANELTAGQQPIVLDTLAMAYAEASRFTGAIQAVQKAIELTMAIGAQDYAAAMRQRLQLYQAGRPYRESAADHAPPRNPRVRE